MNVAMLSASLGRFLGMSRVSLEHLVVCGLFHDLARWESPGDPHEKGLLESRRMGDHAHPSVHGREQDRQLEGASRPEIEDHPRPFEHHLNPDLSGYPKTHFTKGVSIIGRILRIVDVLTRSPPSGCTAPAPSRRKRP